MAGKGAKDARGYRRNLWPYHYLDFNTIIKRALWTKINVLQITIVTARLAENNEGMFLFSLT